MSAALADGEIVVLRALANEGPMTTDRFVTSRAWYVNAWAPHFTRLRQRGLIERTGERALTSHGARAHVVRVTDEGLAALREVTA